MFNSLIFHLYTVCSEKLDIIFALDDSSKVGERNFLKVRNFFKNLMSSFKLDDGSTRVAAMSFSDTANIGFSFDKSAGRPLNEMQNLVQAIPYTGGSTSRLDKALNLATQQLLLKGRSGSDTKKVI